MATILPSQAQASNVTASAPTATAQALPTVTVTSDASALSGLPLGTQLQAEIVEILNRGSATISTDAGTFQIRTNLSLTVGAMLDLELLKNGARPQLAINAVDGKPQPQQAVRSVSPTEATAPQGRGSATSVPPSSITDVVEAPPAIELKPGAVIRAAVLRAGPQFNDPAALLAQGAPRAGISTTEITATPLQTALEALSPGSLLDLKVAGVLKAPPSLLPTSDPTVETNTLKGIFTGITPEGRPIVETPSATLALNTSLAPVAGSEITFTDPHEMPAQGATAESLQNGAVKSLIQTHTWPALEKAIAHLEQQTPATNQPVGTTQDIPLPRPNSQLASNILTFVNALGRDDFRGWFGDAANTLLDQRPDLAQPLREQFSELSQTFTAAPAPDGWRTAFIPFFIGGPHPEAVQMHLRGGSREKGQQRKQDESARFIIDVTLSRFGRVQLDGLVKNRGKAFDLIVRTASALPQRMRRDINRIFIEFEEAAGIHGAVIFQASNKFVEVALPRASATTPDGLLV